MYTYQCHAEPGSSFANPSSGTEVSHAQSHAELRAALEEWSDNFPPVGSSRKDAFLLVWYGSYTDITDIYPDFTVRFGPRKGIRFDPT